MKSLKSILLSSVFATSALAQVIPESSADPSTGRAAWMDEAKYGLFIHWGVYSQIGRGEWTMARAKIPVAEYKEIAATFNPVKFDAEKWVDVAKRAGMKYITITAKHHDGFAMWDSDVYDYNIVDHAAFGRDPLGELKAAADKAGIKLGFYYSQTQDWEFPGGQGKKFDRAVQIGDFNTYLNEKAYPQLAELVALHDPTHIWFDTPHGTTLEISKKFRDIISSHSPDTIVNSRLHMHGYESARATPELLADVKEAGIDFLSYGDREIPPHSPWEYWETCMTLNHSWGYREGDARWKNERKVLMMLTDCVAKGGNLLLNVGPTGEGLMQDRGTEILLRVGEWLEVNGESIYGAVPTIFPGKGDFEPITPEEQAKLDAEALATGAGEVKHAQPKTYAWLATGRPGKVYLHFFDWPREPFVLKGFSGDTIKSAHFLADKNAPVTFQQDGETVTINLPAAPLDPELSTVLCLELN